MKIVLLFSLFLMSIPSLAQFEMGNLNMSFNDVSRNRDIPFELLYPAASSGTGVDCADGAFPYVVIAHGFSMQATDYTYLAEELVSRGYMILQLATESGFAPSHNDYGLDILYLATHFRDQNFDSSSLFFGHVLPIAGVVGHSMGGGSAWLAAATASGNIDCVVGMAPAETNPSAIDAASQVTVPAMILSGSSDAVTPPSQHHLPIFNETASSCKVFVSVNQGSHCAFADGGTLCQFGEFGFNGLDAGVQQNIALTLVSAWMDMHLRGDAAAGELIGSFDQTQSDTETQNNCVMSRLNETGNSEISVFPNPAEDVITLTGISSVSHLLVLNADGRHLDVDCAVSGRNMVDLNVNSFAPGIYTVTDMESAKCIRFLVR